MKRTSAATKYTGDDDPTRFVRRVVVPFQARRTDSEEAVPASGVAPRAHASPAAAPVAKGRERPIPPSARALAAIAPAARSWWPVPSYARLALAAVAVIGAVWSIFMLGILVGRQASPAVLEGPTIAPAPDVRPSAPPTSEIEPTNVVSDVDPAEVESAKDVLVASSGPTSPRPFPRTVKSHGGHGAPLASKRVAKHPAPPVPPPPSRAPTPQSAPSDDDVLGAASAADDLARAQLEAVMP